MPAKILNKITSIFALCFVLALSLRADLLELTNGDHYRGTVLSMDASNVVFQSEIQGRVVLPRSKVAVVTLNAPVIKPVANARPAFPQKAQPAGALGTNSTSALPAQADAVAQELQKQGLDPALIEQVQQQILGKSTPEATAKFN